MREPRYDLLDRIRNGRLIVRGTINMNAPLDVEMRSYCSDGWGKLWSATFIQTESGSATQPLTLKRHHGEEGGAWMVEMREWSAGWTDGREVFFVNGDRPNAHQYGPGSPAVLPHLARCIDALSNVSNPLDARMAELMHKRLVAIYRAAWDNLQQLGMV